MLKRLLLSICILISSAFISNGQYFSIVNGIPHLPVFANTSSVSDATNGMMIYSTADGKPMVCNSSTWLSFCAEGLTTTAENYFVIKSGIPYIPAKATVGVSAVGAMYYSTTDMAIMVYTGNAWKKIKDIDKNDIAGSAVNLTTDANLKVIKVPVFANEASVPDGFSTGAFYLDAESNSLKYYTGSAWANVNCDDYVMPVGAIVPYVGSSPPPGWLLCDGTSFTSASYPDLFNIIGTTYGTGSNDFQVPDLRGRFPKGANSGLGVYQEGLVEAHTHSAGTLTTASTGDTHTHSHDHPATNSETGVGTHTHTFYDATSGTNSATHSHSLTGTAGAHSHTLKQERYDVFTSAFGTGTMVWQGVTTINVPLTSVSSDTHSHTTINDNTVHTHDLSSESTNNSATLSHTHSIVFTSTNSGYTTNTHTHTVNLPANVNANGSGDDTRPDNYSFNYIIRY